MSGRSFADADAPPLTNGRASIESSPTPMDALDRARAIVLEAMGAYQTDPGAPFETAAVAAFKLIQRQDLPLWKRATAPLKPADKKDLIKAIERFGKPPEEDDSQRIKMVRKDHYFLQDGQICLEADTDKGPVITTLSNFRAVITAEEILDDGADRNAFFQIAGRLNDGTPLPEIRVPAKQYPLMTWVTASWGARAIVRAGAGTRDHLRVGIQVMSGEVPQRTVYAHLGWRTIDGCRMFLHAGGGLAASGVVDSVRVQLGDGMSASYGRLAAYVLPPVPGAEDLRRAIRASLGLLELTRPEVGYHLISGAYRAPLREFAPIDFALFIEGETGSQKSELTAIVQAHYGATFHRKNLPAGWTDTENTLEKKAFQVKDAVFTIDDFAPNGTAQEVQRLHQKAERVFRAQGNNIGRGRMRPDGTLGPEYSPRGLILSSGEELPKGSSLKSRLVVLELKRRDVSLKQLTECQRLAPTGIYASAMAGYIRWLANWKIDHKEHLEKSQESFRDYFGAQPTGHDRVPENTASLAVGLECFLWYAEAAGAITPQEREHHWAAGTAALAAGSKSQGKHQSDDDPVLKSLALLRSALLAGYAHVADGTTDQEPENAGRWGWRRQEGGAGYGSWSRWQPQGPRLGWVLGEDLYLLDEVFYAVLQRFAQEQRQSVQLTPRTLWKRLNERGHLVRRDVKRQRFTIRIVICGEQQEVLHLAVRDLTGAGAPSRVSFEDPLAGCESTDGQSGAPTASNPRHEIN